MGGAAALRALGGVAHRIGALVMIVPPEEAERACGAGSARVPGLWGTKQNLVLQNSRFLFLSKTDFYGVIIERCRDNIKLHIYNIMKLQI